MKKLKSFRKLRKLVKNPNLYFRDFFLKRAPLDYGNGVDSLPNEKGFSKSEKYHSKSVSETRKKDIDNHKNIVIGDSTIVEDLYSINFPIDIVFTWVNADDSDFLNSKNHYQSLASTDNELFLKKIEIADIARYESRDELRYALRSLEAYAPWINHVYIVTNGQKPSWLNLNNSKITLVDHSEIIPEQYLPTFNSHVIESCLHRIPNLAEHYIYFNDDVMLTRPVEPSYFFTSGGLAKVFITDSLLSGGKRCMKDTPTQWAAKNARDLIYNVTGHLPNKMFAHTFHPQIKSINIEMEKLWSDEYEQCRKNKFRDESDLLVTSFLHHHFSTLTGRAIATRTKCMYFNIRIPMADKYYVSLLARKNTKDAPYSMCLNDHKSNNFGLDNLYIQSMPEFLDKYFPNQTTFEIPVFPKKAFEKAFTLKNYNEIYELVGSNIDYYLELALNDSSKTYILYYYGASIKKLQDTRSFDKVIVKKATDALLIVLKHFPSHQLASLVYQDLIKGITCD